MNDPMNTHGAFSWCELSSSDTGKSKSFYTSLFNWEYDEMKIQDGEIYHVLKANGQPMGGIMKQPSDIPSEVPSMWTPYITVDDADTTYKKALDMGAKAITPLIDIPDVGKFSYLQDPQGAIFAIITYVKK